MTAEEKWVSGIRQLSGQDNPFLEIEKLGLPGPCRERCDHRPEYRAWRDRPI